MNSMEQKNQTNERRKNLMHRLSQRYEQLLVRDDICFRKTDDSIFTLSIFPGEAAIVIEYAESYEEAILYRYEDGDRFYLADMDEETMFQAMIREIEQ